MLDREAARALARELRRAAALDGAVRALRYRDLSRARLEERLAARGAPGEARSAALETLERAGLVDDARVAAGRAASLSARGFGDLAIRESLEADGIPQAQIREALAALEPEAARARDWVHRRGPGPKTLRWLSAKGFDASSLEATGVFADEA